MGLAEAGLKDDFRGRISPEVLSLLSRISDLLVEQGVEAYLVGGLVRDALLGRVTADIDIAVASDALEVAPRAAAAFGGKYVLLDKVNGVGRVVLSDREAPSGKAQWEVDFSTFEGSIEQDLARRDFTIDAMAVDLGQLTKGAAAVRLIDPFKGRGDLQQGVIRAVTEAALTSDSARLLRAVRLSAELGFSIDKQTEALIQRYSGLVAGVAGERVREELLRMLAVSGSGQLLAYLDELGLLTAVFPEMAEAKGVEQPKEHYWNVFEHSLKTVSAVEFLLRQGAWEYQGGEVLAAVPWSAALAQHFDREVSHGSSRKVLLKLAALLHDIGKPKAKAFDAGGRMRFLGHGSEGATVAAGVLERIRFSAREVRLVETMVRYHLRPGQMSQNELPSDRAIYRYFRDTGEAGIDILFLSLADHLATRGPNLILSHWRGHTQLVDYVLTRRFERESVTHPPRLIDGHDLMDVFGMDPGPKIGEILEAVREAQSSGEVASGPEALAYARNLLSKAER